MLWRLLGQQGKGVRPIVVDRARQQNGGAFRDGGGDRVVDHRQHQFAPAPIPGRIDRMHDHAASPRCPRHVLAAHRIAAQPREAVAIDPVLGLPAFQGPYPPARIAQLPRCLAANAPCGTQHQHRGLSAWSLARLRGQCWCLRHVMAPVEGWEGATIHLCMTNTIGWELYRSFLAVLTEGSLSGAARALGLTQPTVGRHISALETALNQVLFTRSQVGLLPTEAAESLRGYAEAMRSTAAALERAAAGHGTGVSGTVRISASEVIGIEVLPPALARLRREHPGLKLELAATNRTS
ncbi:hypothetical protein G6F65_016480 [Rhizopus arrhizus]|nr:hypothetical protein G6F65_016480 [Rhizopus arrhizus]